MRKICKYFIPWNSVYLRTIHCFCFFFKLQWLKITSSKHSVLGYLLLPAITPKVTPQGPSALKRNLNFTVLQTCLFPLQSSIFLPPPPHPPPTMRGVAVPARPPGPVPLAPSKQQEPLMRLIGISGTGEEALTDGVTDGAGKCWRLPAMEINDYWVSSPPSSA